MRNQLFQTTMDIKGKSLVQNKLVLVHYKYYEIHIFLSEVYFQILSQLLYFKYIH